MPRFLKGTPLELEFDRFEDILQGIINDLSFNVKPLINYTIEIPINPKNTILSRNKLILTHNGTHIGVRFDNTQRQFIIRDANKLSTENIVDLILNEVDKTFDDMTIDERLKVIDEHLFRMFCNADYRDLLITIDHMSRDRSNVRFVDPGALYHFIVQFNLTPVAEEIITKSHDLRNPIRKSDISCVTKALLAHKPLNVVVSYEPVDGTTTLSSIYDTVTSKLDRFVVEHLFSNRNVIFNLCYKTSTNGYALANNVAFFNNIDFVSTTYEQIPDDIVTPDTLFQIEQLKSDINQNLKIHHRTELNPHLHPIYEKL